MVAMILCGYIVQQYILLRLLVGQIMKIEIKGGVGP